MKRVRPMSWIAAPIAVAAISAVTLIPASARQAEPQGSGATFTKDVAPIFQRKCQSCHRPGFGAPMSLTTYEESRPYARAIKQKVVAREMPPWYIDKTIGIQKYRD